MVAGQIAGRAGQGQKLFGRQLRRAQVEAIFQVPPHDRRDGDEERLDRRRILRPGTRQQLVEPCARHFVRVAAPRSPPTVPQHDPSRRLPSGRPVPPPIAHTRFARERFSTRSSSPKGGLSSRAASCGHDRLDLEVDPIGENLVGVEIVRSRLLARSMIDELDQNRRNGLGARQVGLQRVDLGQNRSCLGRRSAAAARS